MIVEFIVAYIGYEINISYWMVQCVVSWDIFTSHAAFWQPVV